MASRPFYNNFNSFSDIQLILLFRTGDEEAFNELYKRYKGLIISISKGFFLKDGDMQDIQQESLIGFYKAVRDFNPFYANFTSFVKLCIRRHLIAALRYHNKNSLGTLVSLDQQVMADSNLKFYELIPSNNLNPETIVLSNEAFEQIFSNFSRFESEILKLYLNGMNHTEISERLGLSYRAILNAMYRVRNKIGRPNPKS